MIEEIEIGCPVKYNGLIWTCVGSGVIRHPKLRNVWLLAWENSTEIIAARKRDCQRAPKGLCHYGYARGESKKRKA